MQAQFNGATTRAANVHDMIALANPSSSGRSFWFLDTRVEVKVSCEENAGRLSVLEILAPYGSSPPLHIHATQDEVFHILEGTLRLQAGSEDRMAGAGETLHAPQRIPHSYRVESKEGARWLVITVGEDFERFVRDLGRTPEGDGLPALSGAPGPEEVRTLTAAAARHRITLIGPPLR